MRAKLLIFFSILLLALDLLPFPAVAQSKELKQSDFEHIDNLLGKSQYDKAIDFTKELERTHPDKKTQLWGERAMLLMYKGDDCAASALAESVLKKDKTNHETHWVLANIYMKRGLSKKGSQEYELSLKNPSKRLCKPCVLSKPGKKGLSE